MIDIRTANKQDLVPIDEASIDSLAKFVLESETRNDASLDFAFVNDATIQRLNLEYLAHDQPTDVLTFPYSTGPGTLEGEIVISTERALQQAGEFGWPVGMEIGLYVIHGLLHLCGHDDRRPADAAAMKERQEKLLAEFTDRNVASLSPSRLALSE